MLVLSCAITTDCVVRYNFLTIYLQCTFNCNTYFYLLKRILGIKRTHYRFHLLDKEEEEEEGFLTLSEGEDEDEEAEDEEGEDEEGEDEEDSEAEDGPEEN